MSSRTLGGVATTFHVRLSLPVLPFPDMQVALSSPNWTMLHAFAGFSGRLAADAA